MIYVDMDTVLVNTSQLIREHLNYYGIEVTSNEDIMLGAYHYLPDIVEGIWCSDSSVVEKDKEADKYLRSLERSGEQITLVSMYGSESEVLARGSWSSNAGYNYIGIHYSSLGFTGLQPGGRLISSDSKVLQRESDRYDCYLYLGGGVV